MIEDVRPSIVRIRTDKGSGSGVIFEVDDDAALVLTNHHVIEDASSVQVEVNDSLTYTAETWGTDSMRDLAVLRICCGEFRALSFGNVSELGPGDEVFAMGYPLGLPGEATVTKGIVSAIRFDQSNQRLVIQTDAAINPGNSGGPMLSEMGEILGINTFRREETESGRPVDNVGFAIAATTIEEQLHTLKTAPPPEPTPPSEQVIPNNGIIPNDPTDNWSAQIFTGVRMKNGTISVYFNNPSPTSEGWTYGVLFRSSGENYHVVFISDGGVWLHGTQLGTDQAHTNLDISSAINTGVNEGNHLMVEIDGDSGSLYINRGLVAELDLSQLIETGEVWLLGASSKQETVNGGTRYSNLQIHPKDDTPTPTPRPAPTPSWEYAFGPLSGELKRYGNFENIEEGFKEADVTLDDVMVEVTFTNPDTDPNQHWYYNLHLRHNWQFNADSPGPGLRVGVGSFGEWWVSGDSGLSTIASGEVSNLNLGGGRKNHLMVIVLQGRGWLFVNHTFIGAFDLNDHIYDGDVRTSAFVLNLGGGPNHGRRVPTTIPYKNFRGYAMRRGYGPMSGTIGPNGDLIGEHRSGVISRDFVAEAEFTNPASGQWDYGFIIRNAEVGHLDIVSVYNPSWWEHKHRSIGDNEYTRLGSGRLSNWRDGPQNRNQLLLIAMGDTGWFFVNGSLESTLDLSRNMEAGPISAMAGFFNDSNRDVDFRKFSVWAP